MHKAFIKVPIYDTTLLVILTNSLEGIQEIFPETEDPVYAFVQTASIKNKGVICLVLDFDSDYKITHGVVAHESLHASHSILENAGIVADFHNDEADAYLTGWITDKVYKVMKKFNKEIK